MKTTRRIATLLLALALLLALTAGPHPTAAQPWAPRDGGNPYGGTPGMHLFLPSRFIESIRRDRLTMARIRNYREAYRKAADSGAYDRRLAGPHGRIPPHTGGDLHGRLPETRPDAPSPATRRRSLRDFRPRRGGAGFGHAPRAEPDATRNAVFV